MFWGFILIYININIGPIDIFPDFIGYIMIYMALGRLSAQHNIYGKGRIPALIMVFVSLLEIIKVSKTNLLTSSIQTQQIWIAMLQQVSLIINIYMIFCICRGFHCVSEDMGLEEFKTLVKSRWSFFLAISLAELYITPFMFNFPESWAPLLFIVLAAYFVAAILFTALVHTARSTLADQDT